MAGFISGKSNQDGAHHDHVAHGDENQGAFHGGHRHQCGACLGAGHLTKRGAEQEGRNDALWVLHQRGRIGHGQLENAGVAQPQQECSIEQLRRDVQHPQQAGCEGGCDTDQCQ